MTPSNDAPDERHAAGCEAAMRVLAEFESPDDDLRDLRRRYRRLDGGR